MKRQTSHTISGRTVGLVALILILCMSLGVGVAWARYRSQTIGNIFYQPDAQEEIFLSGGRSEDGAFLPMPDAWTQTQTGGSLNFTVSNGASEVGCAEDDLTVRIRLFATLGVQDGENLRVTLTVPATGQTYTASATAIRQPQNGQGSPMYHTFGEGWVYRFLDADGRELTWELEGRTLDTLDVQLTYAAADGSVTDAAALQLMVTAED